MRAATQRHSPKLRRSKRIGRSQWGQRGQKAGRTGTCLGRMMGRQKQQRPGQVSFPSPPFSLRPQLISPMPCCVVTELERKIIRLERSPPSVSCLAPTSPCPAAACSHKLLLARTPLLLWHACCSQNQPSLIQLFTHFFTY